MREGDKSTFFLSEIKFYSLIAYILGPTSTVNQVDFAIFLILATPNDVQKYLDYLKKQRMMA